MKGGWEWMEEGYGWEKLKGGWEWMEGGWGWVSLVFIIRIKSAYSLYRGVKSAMREMVVEWRMMMVIGE